MHLVSTGNSQFYFSSRNAKVPSFFSHNSRLNLTQITFGNEDKVEKNSSVDRWYDTVNRKSELQTASDTIFAGVNQTRMSPSDLNQLLQLHTDRIALEEERLALAETFSRQDLQEINMRNLQADGLNSDLNKDLILFQIYEAMSRYHLVMHGLYSRLSEIHAALGT